MWPALVTERSLVICIYTVYYVLVCTSILIIDIGRQIFVTACTHGMNTTRNHSWYICRIRRTNVTNITPYVV